MFEFIEVKTEPLDDEIYTSEVDIEEHPIKIEPEEDILDNLPEPQDVNGSVSPAESASHDDINLYKYAQNSSGRCLVGCCENRRTKYQGGKRIYFYTLGVIRKKNPQRFDEFLKVMNPRIGFTLDSHVICSEHFADDAFAPFELSRVAHSTTHYIYPPRAPKLKDDAWPTLKLMGVRARKVQHGKERKNKIHAKRTSTRKKPT
ncbi:hypothetical protein B566_EDAN013028 [Ephemera danica]|nr:hypothetical protein B566_EDAN013028 [Ephemera danica]